MTGTLGISTFQGATIETTAGGVFDFQSDADLPAVPGDPAERFLNAGTLTKSGGLPQSFVGLELVNSATVSVSSGVLQLSGGDGAGEQGGSFGGTGAAGELEFTGGSWDLGTGTSFDGPVELGSATLALSSGATVPDLDRVDVHADERHRGGCRDAAGEWRLRLGVGGAAGVGGDADRGGRDVHQEWRRRRESDRADVAGGGDGAS